MQRPPLFGLVALGLLTWAPLHAADLLPADQNAAQAIDHYIAEGLKAENASPAPIASDLVILRRTTLDLAGRIPTFAEVEDYLDLVAAIVLWSLLGWHWAFLPTFVAEVVPFVDLFPTWTLAVAFVMRKRKK